MSSLPEVSAQAIAAMEKAATGRGGQDVLQRCAEQFQSENPALFAWATRWVKEAGIDPMARTGMVAMYEMLRQAGSGPTLVK